MKAIVNILGLYFLIHLIKASDVDEFDVSKVLASFGYAYGSE